MAKRKTEKKESPKKALLTRVRTRYPVLVESPTEQQNRRDALEDMKFTNEPGNQWDANMKTKRGKRPCYEFNKLRITCKRVINDMRSNRPMGKVRGVEDSDKDTAEIYEGLIRNIWNNSDGDTVIDYAGEYQVSAGMGAWRINTKYVAEDAFDQDIVVEPLQNPFCLFVDPSAKDPMKRDAADWILTDMISKAAYESRWPNAEKVSWEASEFDDEDDWEDEESVRVVEYWYKEPYEKEIWQLADGKVIDSESDEAKLIDPTQIKRKRAVTCNRVKMCIASGEAILEESEWAGSHFPFVMVYGEHMVIDGKVRWFGLPRFAKDAQRSYNVSRTAMTETVAMTPQAKWWATAEQAKGHIGKWEQSIAENIPALLYNPDTKAPGPPVPMPGAQVPAALVQLSMLDSEDIKGVTGIFDNSLGQDAGEKSGRAIIARQQQGEIATFNYQDNMAKGIRRTWEILIDLVPKIYDTERELRILGSDGAEDYKKVNEVVMDPATGKAIKVNDLAQGRYDVTVTVGPSFSTKRQEASETYLQLAQASPEVMAVAGDLIFKAMDLPYSEDIADRLKAMLPPPIQQLLQKGKQVPAEVAAAMGQVQQAMQQVQQHGQLVQAAEQELKEEVAKAKGDKATAQLAQANLQGAQLQLQAAQEKLDNEKALFDKHVENALLKIQLAETKAANAIEREAHHSDMEHERAANELGHQARDVGDAVTDGSHQLETQKRDVQDIVKDGQHGLEKQATQMSVQNMQAQHKLSQSKPKPAK